MATLRQVFHDIAEAIRSKGITGTFKPIDMAQKIGEIRSLDGYGYLTFTAEENTTITLIQNSSSTKPHNLLKSTDKVNWTKWESPATNGIVLNSGESVYLKSYEETNPGTRGKSNFLYNTFSSSGKIKCDGDIRSIVRMVVPFDYRYWFQRLFQDCTTLTKAPELPATYTSDYFYYYMFYNCASLTQAPELPATDLTPNCYTSMFRDCTSLEIGPTLPATQMSNNCYSNMFQGCTSLKRIKMNSSSQVGWGPNMFNGCTSLELVDMTGSTGVPQLPNVNNFANTNDTYKIVVPDSLYDTWIAATNWASIASHIMKQSDWNAAHPDDQL